MFKKKISLLLTCVLTASCLMAGCGSSSSNTAQSGASGDGSAEKAASEDSHAAALQFGGSNYTYIF